jgi:iron complex outermembrane receptor protein
VTNPALAEETSEKTTFEEELIVTAHPLSGEGLAQPSSTLEGEDLDRALATTLGETLINQPGIHSSTFGAAVGRPVIRGLGGPRVKVMEDRIDSMDVSVSSPDHATSIEPFTADRIEVLKGPSTLLYGNGAIGGVVDVHTGRIPHRLPDQVGARAEVRGADNADQRTAAGRLDAAAGSFALHLDGFYRDADEYEIPGFAESKALRELEEEDGEDGEEGEEEAFGTLPGSQLETSGGAAGLSFVGDRGFIGAAISVYDATYGLPGGHAHEHEEGEEGEEEEEEGNPVLDLEQTRIDFEAGLEDPFDGADSLNIRIGWNDYRHAEIEPSGETGTVFDNKALEGRLEVVHAPVAGWAGAGGMQFGNREYKAIGEEAYVPPVDTGSFGLFYVGERSFDLLELEAGVRYERVSHDPEFGSTRSFDLGAASLGLILPFESGWTIAGQLDYSTRAPTVEELFSDGPHLATRSYEIGDPELDKERAANVSATVQYENDTFRVGVSGYYTDFTDFIFESPTGDEDDGLPVFLWQQANATFHGFDLEAEWRALRWDNGSLVLTGFYDMVRARLQSGENRELPRIPPQRYGIGARVYWHGLTATVDYTRTDDQDRIADWELPTEGFDDLRAYLGYAFMMGESRLEVFVTGRNLTDDEQRYHTSFIKDFAPQPGRTIEGGVRVIL